MLQRSAISGLNHVLKQQEWPRTRLQAFAGRTITLRMPPFPDLPLQVGPDGLLEEAASRQPADARSPDLTVILKPSALPRLIQRDATALRDVELTGAADLAQLAQQLFRDLRWDVEEDLSRVVGDVIAHRMVRTGRDVMAWQAEAAQRLAQNFADYWTDERPTIVRQDAVAPFAADVGKTSARVTDLESRIASLERQAARATR